MKQKTNKKFIIGIVLLTLIVCILGFTFAYFTAQVKGNENASSVIANTGKLIIDFETSEYIDNLYGELIKDEEKEEKASASNFIVRHNVESKGKAKYNLTLTDIEISDNLKSADFKWELLKDGSIINNGDFSSIGNNTTITLTRELQALDQNQSDAYTIRIWLSETGVDQSELYSGEFSARIAISAKSV